MLPKYRAWDKAHEVMRSVLLIDFINRSVICETEDDRNIKLYDTTYELMQYTGLKDRNGVEIHEGDIVKSQDGTDGWIKTFIVKRDEMNGGFTPMTKYDIGWHRELNWVIGNIYETPELLEEAEAR